MASKRKFSEEREASSSATSVECAIQSISPMKKSKKGNDYYVGEGSDGRKSLRFIGFDSQSNEKLSSFQSKGQSVSIRNCTTKSGDKEDEIFINRNTVIEESSKTIDIKPTIIQTKPIRDITELEDGVMVHVRAKILSAEPPRAVSRGLVQDAIIGDGSYTIGLSIWEENINKLEVLKTYKLQGLYTRTYQGIRSLTFTRNSRYYLEEEDSIPIHADDEQLDTLFGAKIMGVQNFCLHIQCINCTNNVLFETNFSIIVRCSSCKVLQSIESRQYEVSTNIIVMSGTEKKTLKLTKDLILKVLDIDDSNEFSEEMECNLLRTPTMDIEYNKSNSYVKDITFNKL